MGVILAEMRGHNGDRRESVPFPRSLQHGHLCPLLDAYNVCLQYITSFKDTYRITGWSKLGCIIFQNIQSYV